MLSLLPKPEVLFHGADLQALLPRSVCIATVASSQVQNPALAAVKFHRVVDSPALRFAKISLQEQAFIKVLLEMPGNAIPSTTRCCSASGCSQTAVTNRSAPRTLTCSYQKLLWLYCSFPPDCVIKGVRPKDKNSSRMLQGQAAGRD